MATGEGLKEKCEDNNNNNTEKKIEKVLNKVKGPAPAIDSGCKAIIPSVVHEDVSPGTQTDRLKREMQQLAFYNPGPSTKDILGFKPEFSNREKRKLNRLLEDKSSDKENGDRKFKKPPLYDSDGVLKENEQDMCDCMISGCPGCHFPCSRCDSEKCGITCRCDRRWKYDSVHYDIY